MRCKERVRAIAGCDLFALLAIFALLATSCRATQTIVEKPVYIHDTANVVKVQIDSVYVDRVRVVTHRGDTIIIYDSIDRWHKEFQRDTIREIKEIPVKIIEKQEVVKEKKMSFVYKLLIIIVILASGIVGLVTGGAIFENRRH